jgi:hypothetical protein
MGGTVPPLPQYAFIVCCSVRGSTGILENSAKDCSSSLQVRCRPTIIVRDLRLSQRWRFKSISARLWCRVVLWQDTNFSKVHIASNCSHFTLKMGTAWISETLVSDHKTTRCYKEEFVDENHTASIYGAIQIITINRELRDVNKLWG